jgi:2-polyprenyl-6-methoxyphenol hydroxylase-like FAD-dependent oxidoreductase
MSDYDLITVGGGLAASALAKGLAESGARVLVVEQERQFKDRVRGEYIVPWGGTEAKRLGIYETIRDSCGHEVPWADLGFGLRDLLTTTEHHLPGLTFSHPEMQETLLAAAARAGADVRRGSVVQGIEPGKTPVALVKNGATSERLSARLIVAADGRGSPARKWMGFPVERNDQPFMFAGVFLQDVAAPPDLGTFSFNPEIGLIVAIIPQAKGRFRAYLGYPTTTGYRLQGEASFQKFRSEAARAVPACEGLYAQAKCIGPLASFDGGDVWVNHPYKNGVALIGDAAATSDPTFGQGMSLALRDARVLRDQLLGNSDWDVTGHRYADEHDAYFHRCHTATVWFRQVFQEQSPEASARRQKALPLISEDATRVPDHIFGGPELPVDDLVRQRFFGEV